MHLHILGISGTFMSALAILAREAGYRVTGCDANCYPPVSDLLDAKGIEWTEGYEITSQAMEADLVIVGNAIKRGMPILESLMNARKPYISGPQWLAENILQKYKVIAISGTHGKTTTTSMLAWILDQSGFEPGFLIGGVATDFKTSARLGNGKWFVIEADEYDSAFFDKRPKFMHYKPEIAILNNLEFDHADIYSDLDAIQIQFHFLLKTIPENGVVIKPQHDDALNEVFAKGVFSQVQEFSMDGNAEWSAQLIKDTGESFVILHHNKEVARVEWNLIGKFNIENGLAAFIAAVNAGVEPKNAAEALSTFSPVKRRLEIVSESFGITIYDDFAHHPTAIAKTIEALKQSSRHQKIIVVLEFASYTMRTGVHAHEISQALAAADQVFILNPQDFDLCSIAKNWTFPFRLLNNVEEISNHCARSAEKGDAILVMSNRGFAGIHKKIGDEIIRFNQS